MATAPAPAAMAVVAGLDVPTAYSMDVIVAAAAVALQAAQAGPAAVTVRFSPMPPKSVATGCALTPPR